MQDGDLNRRNKVNDRKSSYYNSQTILRDELKRILNEKKLFNQNYNLTLFAKELNIPKSSLSEFFSGKLSFKKRIVNQKLSAHIRSEVLQKVLTELEFESTIAFENKKRPDNSVDIFCVDENGEQYLNKNQEAFMRDPYCHAFLVAFDLEDFRPHIDFFTDKFRVSCVEAFEKLELLAELGLLEKTEKFYVSLGKRPNQIRYRKNKELRAFIDNMDQIKSDFLADPDIDHTGKNRNYSHFEWFYTPLNHNDVDAFKEELRTLTRKFHQKQLSSKPKKVYAFNLNFYPVEKQNRIED